MFVIEGQIKMMSCL